MSICILGRQYPLLDLTRPTIDVIARRRYVSAAMAQAEGAHEVWLLIFAAVLAMACPELGLGHLHRPRLAVFGDLVFRELLQRYQHGRTRGEHGLTDAQVMSEIEAAALEAWNAWRDAQNEAPAPPSVEAVRAAADFTPAPAPSTP
jgi:hypothetical protein